MADFTQPSEIAREALRRMASRRIAPTPENYHAIYHEIAGTSSEEVFPSRALKSLARALPRSTPESLARALEVEHAVDSGQWPELRRALVALASSSGSGGTPWGSTLLDLVRALARQQSEHAPSHPLLELLTVLESAPRDADMLHTRLLGLTQAWNTTPASTPASPPPRSQHACHGLAALLREGIAPLLAETPGLAREAAALAESLSAAPSDEPELTERLRDFSLKLEWLGEDQRAIRDGLTKLLRLIVDNIGALVLDDQWLHGQIALLSSTFEQPLDVRALDELERRLRNVIVKQTELKAALSSAQERLKGMLAGFIDRLAEFSDSTGSYHRSLEDCAERIAQANDIGELSALIEDVLRETRSARDMAGRSHRELAELRELVGSANQQILRLQRELDETSDLIRHDPLTGTLNRKGLDETLEREITRARHRGTPLCLSLLDIDNFKQLNDTHGHVVGDDALRHLASVVREQLRPQDAVARYGGEEFLVVLPDTDLSQASEQMSRLQRELTKRFFLAGNQRLLITFSAGVARLHEHESPLDCIDRADRAMYAAKRAGKNRVLAAP